MSRQFRSSLLAIALALTTAAGCARAPALSVDGLERPVTSAEASRSAPNSAGFVDLRLSVLSDVDPAALDDELTVELDVHIDDETALKVGEPIALGDNVAATSFRFGCLCGPEADAPLGTVEGTLTLDQVESPALRGVLAATIERADESGRDLGTVTIVVPFDVR